ncbi:MAG: hypothetical protein PHR35_12615 [Kiritimatiellae bacterium]|nr:hypothetical protein [Kiritimatiellia bacterium]
MGQKWKYTLDRDLMHHSRVPGAKPFRNAWFQIMPVSENPALSELTLFTGYSWDGCSCAPEMRGTRAASGFHDGVYQFAEQIAAAWGWTVRRVLRWGDEVFLERMKQDGAAKAVAYPYYWAVRTFGGAFHALMRLVRGPADERRGRSRQMGVSK